MFIAGVELFFGLVAGVLLLGLMVGVIWLLKEACDGWGMLLFLTALAGAGLGHLIGLW